MLRQVKLILLKVSQNAAKLVRLLVKVTLYSLLSDSRPNLKPPTAANCCREHNPFNKTLFSVPGVW